MDSLCLACSEILTAENGSRGTDRLGGNRCNRRACASQMQNDNTEQIKENIQDCRKCQKQKRRAAVPDGTQDAGKIIVQNRKRNPEENHKLICVSIRENIGWNRQ